MSKYLCFYSRGFPHSSAVKQSACNAGDPVLGQEDLLEKG